MNSADSTAGLKGDRTAAETAATATAAGHNLELSKTLYNFLHWMGLDSAELTAELEKLEQTYAASVYSELLFLLSHLHFEHAEAKRHWQRILEHRASMQERLGCAVDLRVALVSYFVEVDRQFKNPKLIEMRLFEQTRASAYLDELTGLRNFRFFREFLQQEVARSDQYNTPLSLVMIDVDNFKRFNDLHGHEAGNRALSTIADALGLTLRKVDVAVRYGGEEFALVLPSTTKIGARVVAERARGRIAQHPFEDDSAHGAGLTVSMGIATYPADAHDAGELVRHADEALYSSKAAGKNRVWLFGESTRSYRRVAIELRGHYSTLSAECHPITTLKVSEGGMLFRTEKLLQIGSLIDIRLDIPGGERDLAICARVVDAEPSEAGTFTAAVRFLEVAARDRGLLADFIRRVG